MAKRIAPAKVKSYSLQFKLKAVLVAAILTAGGL